VCLSRPFTPTYNTTPRCNPIPHTGPHPLDVFDQTQDTVEVSSGGATHQSASAVTMERWGSST
jgi:hypothetical protein